MNSSPTRKGDEAYELENAATVAGSRIQSRGGDLEYTAEEEAKIIRKLDYRLLPFLLLLYTFSVLDRSNLGMCCFVLGKSEWHKMPPSLYAAPNLAYD